LNQAIDKLKATIFKFVEIILIWYLIEITIYISNLIVMHFFVVFNLIIKQF